MRFIIKLLKTIKHDVYNLLYTVLYEAKELHFNAVIL